ncbi:NAD(P)-binding protein [Metschnikowia bicuspidata var. bicuspidata NRRL YB-4993]|uniref:NAD(P)-binding protein n=1 Tax=Metschnikowia bicuspidata var. bicuspidata NRRL YB-4993 TaxID=869754 RepID=A0A1A0H978_9ASCO|nr:NAD(P)-binding protein [Metschnikowia bicuspidata var. bicuspidata NRRL YB-4993]OBA20442.1 NAD(P)-binding protein [Metschnikowia bicuspidata var. bicuspidata NRRL YB-4993]
MKVISDSAITAYLMENLDKDTILNVYVPLLLSGLTKFQQFPDAVPERTVRVSTTPDSDSTHLFMPCILPEIVGVKVISGGPSNLAKGLGFQGNVSVLDEYLGELLAVLNAKTLTAFRTALASCVSMVKVFDPKLANENLLSLLVFGAGPQAFWHVILATRLYPNLAQVNIISRTSESAKTLAHKLRGVITQKLLVFGFEDVLSIEASVRESSLIFGCTPSTDAIIKSTYINSDPGKTTFVSLIGSYKPHMIELDLQFLREFYTGQSTKIIVDSKSHCLSEAGELIQGNISESQLISLTELDEKSVDIKDIGKSRCGVVLQKLVGLLVMDIVVAKHFARHIEGHAIDDF